MVAAARPESRPYQTYTSPQSEDPRIQQLNQKINELMQRLQEEKSTWRKQDPDTINNLENELAIATSERNELRQKSAESEQNVPALANALENANDSLKKRDYLLREHRYLLDKSDSLLEEADFLLKNSNKELLKTKTSLERANEHAQDIKKNAGIGFAGAAAGALAYGLPPEWALVSAAVGCVAGVYLGDAMKKCPEKPNG